MSAERETLARFNAVNHQYDFARAHWRQLGLASLTSLLAIPPAYLAHGAQRGFIIGVFLTTVAAMLVHWVIVASGSATLMMGDQSEVWTRSVVAPLRKSGWEVIHNARLKARDIDTVLIGPAGVVVLETKWSGSDWSSPYGASRITEAAWSARESARLLRLHVQTKARPVTGAVHTAVVLWGPTLLGRRHVERDVVVIDGNELGGWLHELPMLDVSKSDITTAATLIAETTDKREAYEQARRGRRPRTPNELFNVIGQYALGGWAGTLGTLLAARGFELPEMFGPMAVATTASYLVQRLPVFRRVTHGVFIGSAGTLGVALLAVPVVHAWFWVAGP